MDKYTQPHRLASKRWKANNREQNKLINKRWNDNNPDRQITASPKVVHAHNLARTHISLIGKICQFGGCNTIKNLQRCHIDYDNPLEVIIMCSRHHRILDNLYKEEG